jgi:hypothetical protein
VQRAKAREEMMKRILWTLLLLSIFLPARVPAKPQKVEIFGPDGTLLGELPLNHVAHGIRICNEFLFLWEWNTSTVYQYRILEN